MGKVHDKCNLFYNQDFSQKYASVFMHIYLVKPVLTIYGHI